jgi:FkbM family methyltransferase
MTPDPQTAPQDGQRPTHLRGRSLLVSDDKPTFWDKAAAGLWEPELLAAIEQNLAPGDSFLDIGAWVGPTTLFAADLGAQVTSVEADPRAVELLAGNVAANPGLAPRIRIVAKAASPRPGRLRLGAPRKPGDSMGSLLLADGPHAWEVETISPETLAELARPAVGRRLVVKLDIDGGEYELVPPLAKALAGLAVQALIIAFHPGLLRATGRDEAAIATATRDCFAALEGWEATGLDGHSPHGPEAAARDRNATFVFTRAS